MASGGNVSGRERIKTAQTGSLSPRITPGQKGNKAGATKDIMIDISKGRYWDFGINLVEGCTPCSPGCNNCWAMAMEARFRPPIEQDHYYLVHDFSIKTHPERLARPLKRKKPAVYSLWNDLFHSDVRDGFQESVYHVIRDCKQHTFLILTKRPSEMLRFTDWYTEYDKPIPDNIWHGLTVCNQQEANEKIPVFLMVPGKKFLSIEPMLEPVTLRWISAWNGKAIKPRPANTNHLDGLRMIDAVILGGETGPKARPIELDWIRKVRDDCEEAGVSFFLKHINKKEGRILDGREHNDLLWVK